MPKTVVIRHPGFGGGVNLRDAPNQLDPDQARAILNMTLDERGGARKRSGSELMANLGARIISSHTFYLMGGGFQVMVHLSDGSIHYSTDMVNFTSIWTGLSTTAPMSFETYNNHVYMSNGVDDYRKWSGSVPSVFVTAPKGKFLRVWKDAMWVSGVVGQESRVYTSDPGNPDVFPALGFVDIHKGDGDRVMGLASVPDGLLVPKQRRTHLMYDPVTFGNRIVDPDKGCESHQGIIQHLGVTYILNRQGVCIYHGAGPMQIISDNIEPLFQHNVLNLATLDKTWAYTHENRVGWSVPEVGSTTNSLQLEFYPTLERHPWTFHRMPAQCFSTVREGSVEHLHYGSSVANKFMRAFVMGMDDEVPVSSLLETGWFDFEEPSVMKYLRNVRILGRGRFFLSTKREYEAAAGKGFTVDLGDQEGETWGGPGELWGEPGDLWGPTSVMAEQLIETDFYGRTIAFRFSDVSEASGSRLIDVGGVTRSIPTGQWAIYDLHGYVYNLGDRR